MWQVLAAACCLHPAKAFYQLRAASSLEKRVRSGQWGNKEGDAEVRAANLEGLPLLTGIKPTFRLVLLDLSGCGVIKLQAVGETKKRRLLSVWRSYGRFKKRNSQVAHLIYVSNKKKRKHEKNTKSMKFDKTEKWSVSGQTVTFNCPDKDQGWVPSAEPFISTRYVKIIERCQRCISAKLSCTIQANSPLATCHVDL